MTTADWQAAVDRIETYRQSLNESNRSLDLLYFYIVDYSSAHSQSTSPLRDYLKPMRLSLSRETEFEPSLSDVERKMLEKLLGVKLFLLF
jgi:hypothetical protein